MATEKIKRKNDPALSKAEAEGGSKITSGDVARALTKWKRRTSGLEARLKRARAN